MAQTVVQSVTPNGGTNTGQWIGISNPLVLQPFGSNVTPGNDIVVLTAYADFGQFSGGATMAVSDGQGPYTQEISIGYQAYVATISRLRRAVGGNIPTITCTGSGTGVNSYGQAICFEVSGNSNSAADKTSINTNSTSTTPTSNSTGTLSQAAEIIFACFAGNGVTGAGGMTHPPTSSGLTFTDAYTDTATTVMPCSFAYAVSSATTAVNAAFGTLTTGSPWGIALATFLSSGGAAVTHIPSGMLLGVGS